MTYKMVFDLNKCVGCGTCAIACMDQCDIDTDKDVPFRRIQTKEILSGASVIVSYLSVGCMHCTDASCIDVCPRVCYARYEATGLVLLDNSGCIGCRACEDACPLKAIGFGKDGRATKCNGCSERLKLGLKPACEKACQNNAIRFQLSENSDGEVNRKSVAKLTEALNLGAGNFIRS